MEKMDSTFKIAFGYGKSFVEIALSGVSEGTIRYAALLVIYLTAFTTWFWLFLQWILKNQF